MTAAEAIGRGLVRGEAQARAIESTCATLGLDPAEVFDAFGVIGREAADRIGREIYGRGLKVARPHPVFDLDPDHQAENERASREALLRSNQEVLVAIVAQAKQVVA